MVDLPENVEFLDDRRSDIDFLNCMERRARAFFPENDPNYKWVVLSYNKKDGEVLASTSEPLTMIELTWLFERGKQCFGPLE